MWLEIDGGILPNQMNEQRIEHCLLCLMHFGET